MNSFTLISLVVIIASAVNAEEAHSSLYTRRIPSSEYQSRNLHPQIIPNQQDQAKSQQMRAAQFAPTASQQSNQYDARKIDLIVRRYADQASQLVSHWARAMKERMIDQAAAESQSAAQQHGSHIH